MVQLEFGFLLGPADGRYLVRAGPASEPEFVVVLRTLAAPQRRLLRRRRPRAVKDVEAVPVPTTRAGVVRAEPLGSEREAQGWLDELRRDRGRLEQEMARATRQLNRLMRAHRAAAADPYARDVGPGSALVVRIGHGSGEQVAAGRFAAAVELPPLEKRRRRIERLSPQERLAAVLGGRDAVLASDELVLRSRADLDAGRPREAALQARIAFECVLEELSGARLGDLRTELEHDRQALSEAARAALAGSPSEALMTRVEQAVGRLESALRRHRASSS